MILFGILITKRSILLSLASSGNLKYDWVISTIEMLTFLPLINSSVTFELSFFLLIIQAIISKTINTLYFFPKLYYSTFL